MQILEIYLGSRTNIFKELKKRFQEQEVDAKALNEIVENVLAENNTKHDYCEKVRQALEQFNKEFTEEIQIDSNITHPQTTDDDYNKRIKFCRENSEIILKEIAKINPNLNDQAMKSITDDLCGWTFHPSYSWRSETQLIDSFKEQLTKRKTQKFSKNGKSMEWIIKLYEPLNIELTINHLKKLSGN